MKKQWMRGILSILFCAMVVMLYPVQAKAASQSDRDAYRAVFDASYYYNTNPDVAAACGMDEEALFNHFVTFGVYEGRSASAEFNPQAYRQCYTDLQEAFGGDMAAYCRHYVSFGRAEGRCGSANGQVVVPTNYVTVSRETTPVAETTSEEKQTQEVATASEKNQTQETEQVVETTSKEEQTQDVEQIASNVAKKLEVEEPEQVADNTAKKSVAEETDNEPEQMAAEETDSEPEQVAVEETDNEPEQVADNMNKKSEQVTDAASQTQKQSANSGAQVVAQASVIESDVDMVGTAPEEVQTGVSQVIGTYTTMYEDNVSRAINVELAAQRINGVVVQPGGGFSFSDTILERTEANGYADGPIFVRGEEVIGIGGGVCQVSSTLYAAMVAAGLPATERHAHSMPVDYVPQDLDATIAGDYLDLKFDNTFSQPVMIQASAEGGILTVTLVLE